MHSLNPSVSAVRKERTDKIEHRQNKPHDLKIIRKLRLNTFCKTMRQFMLSF